MSSKVNFLKYVYLLIGSITLMLFVFSCNPKKENSESTAFAGKTSSDTIIQNTPRDTQVTAPLEANSTPSVKEENKPVTPKVCSPNFNQLSHPAKNHYIFYVSDFQPGEFKCWADLENHGKSLCGQTPCLIYYVDVPKVNTNSKPPYYIDMASLKTHGIGQFERTQFNWEVNGSRIWGREGKEFVYYNTDNHLGG